MQLYLAGLFANILKPSFNRPGGGWLWVGLILLCQTAWAADVDSLLAKMTLDEKAALVCGDSLFTAPGVPRFNVPGLSLSDGPQGVREEQLKHHWGSAGWTNDFSTCLPCGLCLAATWNPDLARAHGEVLGAEARARGKDVILAPGINILRTPLCGRNFEYQSEDPCLASRMVVAYVRAVQSQGVAVCVKHFALNNQETNRESVNVDVDDTALREIYLPAFRAALTEGGALCVMSAYNRFQGDFCSENPFLLHDVLNGEWGFKGLVISDWGAVHDSRKAAVAGMDLEMMTQTMTNLAELVRDGKVSMAELDDKVRGHLFVRERLGMLDGQPRPAGSFNTPEHQAVARRIAEEGIVLLKNKKDLLPLDLHRIKTLAVIGPNADKMHATGGGSCGIKALYEITPLAGIRQRANQTMTVLYASGVPVKGQKPEAARQEAITIARKADVVVFVGGLDHTLDQEGNDRPDLKLPYGQDELIQAVVRANPHTVVVLNGSGAVEMDAWLDRVPALMQLWYAGMEAGNALADVLFGDVNPSGHLPLTIPRKLADCPAHAFGPEAYPGVGGTVHYQEGLLVGYRWFDRKGIKPLFPFGFGLSYTQFKLSDLQCRISGDSVVAGLTIANTGKRAGAEVVQFYVSRPENPVSQPLRELKAFSKVALQPGESRRVQVTLGREAFASWKPAEKQWVVDPGRFVIAAGVSSRNLPQQASVDMPPARSNVPQ